MLYPWSIRTHPGLFQGTVKAKLYSIFKVNIFINSVPKRYFRVSIRYFINNRLNFSKIRDDTTSFYITPEFYVYYTNKIKLTIQS